jgi:pyruvate dehydrogenase E2 component (dihydrolipoamide acetyltransferase)
LAVATDLGLLVPVIRDAGTRSLAAISAERGRVTTAVREGTIELADMAGATTSLSSLAQFGIDAFNAMLDPPEAAILAVGPARPCPVVRDGVVAAGETIGSHSRSITGWWTVPSRPLPSVTWAIVSKTPTA